MTLSARDSAGAGHLHAGIRAARGELVGVIPRLEGVSAKRRQGVQ